MGRLLLLLLAGAVLGSIALVAGRADLDVAGSERETQSAALAREVAASTHAATVNDLVDPATRRFRTSLTVPADLTLDGGRAHRDEYRLENGNREAVVTVTGYAGGVAHRITSRYRLSIADFPGPLWIDAPVASASIATGATIAGLAPDGTTRPVYFDATRFAAYRLGSSIPLAAMEGALGAQVRRGGSRLSVQSSMDGVLSSTGTPTLSALYGMALSAAPTAGDVLWTGGHTVSGTEAHGNFDDAADPQPRIVRAAGPLTVPVGATLSGNGMLIVEGDLTVAGTLRWDGLVLVVPPTQAARVTLPGTVEIRGSLMIDQEAPPPGGHTDLTVNRDLTGAWATPTGTPGDYWWALRHSHRIEGVIPSRTFHFAAPGTSPHEGYTRFEGTLAALTGPVYLRFKNPANHGAARVTLRLGGVDHPTFSVAGGFPPALARGGDSHASRTFAPADLARLVVEVRSLRMLAHLTNGDASGIGTASPNHAPVGRCNDRPACVGQLTDRDGALALQIVRASDDRVVYDASMYWHTKEPGHAQHAQEAAADAAWRASVASATTYGTRIEMGAGTTLAFSVPRMTPIAARLGLAGTAVAHVGSRSRHWVVGESAASDATGGSGGVTVCAAGATRTLAADAARAAVRRGASLGAC